MVAGSNFRPPAIIRVEWDSSLFGLRIGRLVPDADEHTDLAPIAQLDRSAFDCVWVDLDVQAIHLLDRWAALGARVVDGRVELASALGSAPAESPSAAIERVHLWSDEDRDAVTALAVEQSGWSRLARDPGFAAEVPRMYAGWVGLAFSGEHEALVRREGGRIVGMLTVKRTPDAAWIELLDVERGHQGHGIGGALVGEFLRIAAAEGHREARVRTQLRNLPAIRTYERAGFAIARVTFLLHWWSSSASSRRAREESLKRA